MPDVAINCRVRPVGLHANDRKAMPLDQATRDGGAGTIELRGSVGRLAEWDDGGLAARQAAFPSIISG
jgi:hypothetical protein